MNALQTLDARINANLQSYLSTPIEDRTVVRYEGLVEQLSLAAMDYAKAMVQERVTERRRMQKGVAP